MALVRRRKARIVSREYEANSDTGEVVSEKVVYAGKYDADVFVKMFSGCADVLKIVSGSEWKVFCLLSLKMERESSVVRVSGDDRKSISEACGLNVRYVVICLSRLVSLGLLKRLQNGVYEVNSDLMFNGNRLKKK